MLVALTIGTAFVITTAMIKIEVIMIVWWRLQLREK